MTATFDPLPVNHTLSVTLAGTGTGGVSSDPPGIDCPGDCSQSYLEGTVVTLTATPDEGSTFAGWSGDCSGTASCSVTMDAARSVTATFTLLPDPTADLSVTQTDTPDPVTGGNAVNYVITVSNAGPDAATNVTLVDTLPAGTTLISSSAGCSLAGTTVICPLGTLASGASANVSIVVRAPNVSSATVMTNSATASASETDPASANNTSAEGTTVVPAGSNPDVAAGWVPAAGGTVSTGASKPPSKKDPMTTSVTVPPGFPGLVTIVEGPITNCAAGYRCFGQEANITAPTTTAATPLRLTFLFHPSILPPSTQLREVVMFHDDVLVPRCTGAAGVANPDPCISLVDRVKGDIKIVVLSSENGSWRGGR